MTACPFQRTGVAWLAAIAFAGRARGVFHFSEPSRALMAWRAALALPSSLNKISPAETTGDVPVPNGTLAVGIGYSQANLPSQV